MSKIITVEFSAKNGEVEFKEESVTLKNVDEFLDFVSPGGGCEAIPSEVDEIQMVFLSANHPAAGNSLAAERVSLQIGMIVFSGPLSEISQTIDALLDKAGRNELSESFLTVAGVNTRK